MQTTQLRAARPDDCEEVRRLVAELAAYEREPDAAVATADDFRHALFPDDAEPVASAVMAERDGRVVGMALWYRTFSTWTGKPGIHLEDLYVEESSRGLGIGKALLQQVAAIAVERGWPRVDWEVLTWNTPSIDFYEAMRAVRLDEWWSYRLTGDALGRAARHTMHG